VQGKRPEVPSEDLDPSSRNATSGLLSHQHLEIPPYDLILLTCHFGTFLLSFFAHFVLYDSGPDTESNPQNPLDLYTDYRPFTRIYRPGIPLFHSGGI
jgi:hypothetical protein